MDRSDAKVLSADLSLLLHKRASEARTVPGVEPRGSDVDKNVPRNLLLEAQSQELDTISGSDRVPELLRCLL